jgi:hypothetical protein
MRRVALLLAVFCLCLFVAIPAHSQNLNQLLQGSEIHLVLEGRLNTSVAHAGDPFIASVADPVYVGDQLVLPEGTRITGIVGAVIKPKHFAIFRGQAAFHLAFKTIEIDHREIPVQLSILTIQRHSPDNTGRTRRDIKVEEGQVIQAKHDVKADVVIMGLGIGGGALAGAVVGNAGAGIGIGIAASAVYLVARKGKDVDLPAQTGLFVRLENTLVLPTATVTSTTATQGGNQ